MIKTPAPSLTFSCAPINFSLPLLCLQTPWLHSRLHCPDLFSSGCFIPPQISSPSFLQQQSSWQAGSSCLAQLFLLISSSAPLYLPIWIYLFMLFVFSQFGALLTLASFSHSSQPDRTDEGTTETISAGEYKKERPREVLRGTDSARRRKKQPEPFLLTGTPPAAALCPLLTCSVPPPSPWSPLWDLFTTCLNQEAYQGIPGSPGDRFREKTY